MSKRKRKDNCQIFTPDEICEYVLNLVGYNENLFGKKVLENSCGDGKILTKIVDRYILACKKVNLELSKIKKGLEEDIFAFEIDMEHLNNCIIELNKIALSYGIDNVKWNLNQQDYLKTKMTTKFNYIIGNPPYISYRDLSIENREYVKMNFDTCKKGKFDYCYAFIEKSIIDLKTEGKMVYVIPSSIFKNAHADYLREYIKSDLIAIYDFKNRRIFKNALTASAIIVLNKNSNNSRVNYINLENPAKEQQNFISKNNLKDKWIFYDFENNDKYKFGEFFDCSVSIATLLNEVFIINNYSEDKKFIIKNGQKIEKSILKNAISPRNINYKTKEMLVFPYYYNNDKLEKMSESNLRRKYPHAYNYLQSNKEKLLLRTSDRGAEWYEYGRSQALTSMNQEKLLLSTIVTNNVKVYNLTVDEIPYSGIYITKKSEYPLILAKKILESERFKKYVISIGISVSGKSIRISPSDIKRFTFSEEEISEWKN